jgi:hypothetical protein
MQYCTATATTVPQALFSRKIGTVQLFNNTNWELYVEYMSYGKQISKVLYPYTKILLGQTDCLRSIYIKRHGRVWGWKAQLYSIDLNKINQDPDLDVIISIKPGWTCFNFESTVTRHEESALSLPQINHPWEAFSSLINHGYKIQPYHVLNISEDADYSALEQAHTELVQLWSSHNSPYAKQVLKIIEEAYITLSRKNELRNYIRHLETKLSKDPTNRKLEQLINQLKRELSAIDTMFQNERIGEKTFQRWSDTRRCMTSGLNIAAALALEGNY